MPFRSKLEGRAQSSTALRERGRLIRVSDRLRNLRSAVRRIAQDGQSAASRAAVRCWRRPEHGGEIVNAAFLLLTSAWFVGADPAPAAAPAPAHPAPPAAACGGCGGCCCDCGCCCCRPTLRERLDAFMNACGSCCNCGCCGCGCCDCCCCKPTLRDRIDAFLNACGAPRCCGCCNCCCAPCCGK